MILQPCNVELTKIHYYDGKKQDNNLSISTISREVCQNNFNKNVIIKKNVFGHRWVLRLNESENEGKGKRKLRMVVYVLVFCSLVVAVCFGIFFSTYKNRYKSANQKIHVRNDTYLNSTSSDENIIEVDLIEDATNFQNEDATTGIFINVSSTFSSICGECSFTNEVCLKIEETDLPKCMKIVDKNDPTGCGGICPINTHFCQILDPRGRIYQCSPVKKALICPNNTFNCGNLCISQEKRCDGLVHCSNASDEDNCVCDLDTHFHCGNLTSCLEMNKKCDHKVDCWDKSDEMDCTKEIICSKDEIPCTNGQCVPKEKFCDENFDCLHRTDEPDGCQI